MALKLYNPKTKAFTTFSPPSDADLPLDQMLLVNILIELKSINHFMSLQQAGSAYEDPMNILTDIVSV
jgi:hypothetical protein